jgi:hypothetical protein
MSVDAYVFGSDSEPVVRAVSTAIGAHYSCERLADFEFYEIGGCRLVVNQSESGYLCYSLVRCSLWGSDLEFARFLATSTGRSVRCDPGPEFPEVSPYSDTFLQIENGIESLFVWYGDDDE